MEKIKCANCLYSNRGLNRCYKKHLFLTDKNSEKKYCEDYEEKTYDIINLNIREAKNEINKLQEQISDLERELRRYKLMFSKIKDFKEFLEDAINDEKENNDE